MRLNVPKLPRCRSTLRILLLVVAAGASASGTTAIGAASEVAVNATAHGVSLSRFSELARRAQAGTAEERTEFAAAAIDAVVESYLKEVEQAGREPAKNAEERRRRYAWRAGTLDYVRDLRAIAGRVGSGSPVEIMIERDGAVRVLIGSRQLMIDGPRAADQDRLEASIARAMCAITHCLGVAMTIEERVDAHNAKLQQGWVFERKTPPTYASSDGLHCVFRDRKHMKLKQAACESLLYELRLLAEALKAVDGRGFPVQWDHLSVDNGGPERPHRVTYDGQGRFFHLRLPHIYRWTDAWLRAIPWLRAYARGSVRQHYIQLSDSMVYVAQAP